MLDYIKNKSPIFGTRDGTISDRFFL